MAKPEPYPSEFTGKAWEIIHPLLPPPSKLGWPTRYHRKQIIEAILM